MIGNPFTRLILYILGWISLILGVIGAILPIMPTVPFVILAAYCFSKSSPKMHSLLTSMPYFGSAIIDWENNRVIRPRAKKMAVSVLWIVMGISIVITQIHIGFKIMLVCIGVLVTVFILTRKSYAENLDHSNHSN